MFRVEVIDKFRGVAGVKDNLRGVLFSSRICGSKFPDPKRCGSNQSSRMQRELFAQTAPANNGITSWHRGMGLSAISSVIGGRPSTVMSTH